MAGLNVFLISMIGLLLILASYLYYRIFVWRKGLEVSQAAQRKADESARADKKIREVLKQDYDELKKDYDSVMAQNYDMFRDYEEICSRWTKVVAERDELQSKYDQLLSNSWKGIPRDKNGRFAPKKHNNNLNETEK